MKIINKFKIMTYNIGFIKKDLNEIICSGISENDIVWLKHKYRDRYFADPFMIKQDMSNYYILVEEYPFWSEIGRIVLLKVDKATFCLKERKLFIEEPYHLSFPYCKCNGEWIVPEASASKEAYAYRVDTDTLEVIDKIKIANDGLIDNVFFKDENDCWWIYAGRTSIPSTELYVYKLQEKGLFELAEKEPLQSDNRRSRSAGDFFVYNEILYRPVQDCMDRYGRQTKIMKVLGVGERGYDAKEVITLNSFQNPPYDETMHTFNVYNDIIIVDGSKDFMRFPMKIYYKMCKWLIKKKNR